MLKGYTGILAWVDLTSGKIRYETLEEKYARKFIGGVGFAAHILWRNTGSQTSPVSPENILTFITGPLTGTSLPKSSRCTISALSPLTGIWGQAHIGGMWPDELRHAGFDGIVVTGRSSRPVYLWVRNGEVEVRDAGHIWGTDTYQASDALSGETGRGCAACIGQAGERLVNFAAIVSEGKRGRVAARCGLGAVMGSKKLKAVVVKGGWSLKLHDEARFAAAVRGILDRSPVLGRDVATEAQVKQLGNYLRYGRAPIKNWSQGTYDAGLVYADYVRTARPLHCKHCPYDCLESHLTPNGERHVVWEAWGPLGTNCLIAEPGAMQEAFSLCQRYGLDAISVGAAISFAMECYDKGLITPADADGLELRWGNARAMLELVRKIGEREGFGELLGQGVRIAAERIGGTAREYAMHIKGLEVAAHDPRSANSCALAYATGSIGAAHKEAPGQQKVENSFDQPSPLAAPELGFPTAFNRFDVNGKGMLTARFQDLGCVLDSLTICQFLTVRQWVQPSHYCELLNAATGWDVDVAELVRVGERVWNLKRMFNVRRGISRKDDTLPARFLTQRLTDSGNRGNLPPLGEMLSEYYSFRGWSEEGVPTVEKLAQLGLTDCLPGLRTPNPSTV